MEYNLVEGAFQALAHTWHIAHGNEQMKWSLGDKGLLVLAIPFAVQIILLVTLGAMQRAAEQALVQSRDRIAYKPVPVVSFAGLYRHSHQCCKLRSKYLIVKGLWKPANMRWINCTP